MSMKVGGSDHLSFDGRRLIMPSGFTVSEATPDDGDVTVSNGGSISSIQAVRTPARAKVTPITIFQAGHTFTVLNSPPVSNLNDTSTFTYGKQSAYLTTGTTNGNYYIQRIGAAAVDATNKLFRVTFRVDNLANLQTLMLYVGDTSLANNSRWNLDYPTATPQPYSLEGEWVTVTLPWGDAATTGAGATKNNITDIRVQVKAVNGAACTVHLNEISVVAQAPSSYTNGVVSFCYDDAYLAGYTEAKAALDLYGFKASYFPVLEALDSGGSYMTSANLATIYQQGHEVCNHASTWANHTAGWPGLSSAQRQAEADYLKKWLLNKGYTRGIDHFAWPNGKYDSGSVSDARLYFATARATYFQTKETLPPASTHRLRCVGMTNASISVATAEGYIDQAYANGEWLILLFHNLVSASPSGNDYYIGNHQSIVDYCNTKGIAVAPIGEVYRTL